MRIDSHVCHSVEHPPEHLRSVLERNRFDGALLVVDAPVAIEPWVLGLLIRATGVDRRALDEYQGHPAVRGILCTLEEAFAIAGYAPSVPLDIEMQPGDLPQFLDLAGRYPDVRLVIDHLARPNYQQSMTSEWAHGMQSAAAFPQVYCKLSGLLSEADLPWSAAPIRPFVQHALAVFSPSRLMFGSEWPRRLPDIAWKESLAAFTQSIGAHSLEVREQLLGETARAVYGL